ncbi:hypothetical protein [Mycobacterium malmoense]|uniref:hypothetical protein n=1 Tax=Mycobacterium malmoense TaxID=1780 RepID=UPI0015A650BD|nr:hypothetical protein [Mycobacterium malmoense]
MSNGPQLSQPAVTLEFVCKTAFHRLIAVKTDLAHDRRQPLHRHYQVTVEFELLDYAGD